jgi:ABC-type Fe3+-citrate transport system substrate-binding protein
VKDLRAKIKCYRNKSKELQRLMSERVTDEMLMKQLKQLKNENGHLRGTVTLLRNEMEQLNEQKNYETSFLKECPLKGVSNSEPCQLKARMDLLLERLADFNTNIYNFQEERQE